MAHDVLIQERQTVLREAVLVTQVVAEARQGPPGPPGPPGQPGGAAGVAYTHVQTSPAAVWTVAHNLGRYPSITVVDHLGGALLSDVRYLDDDIAQISHSVPLIGRVYCN